MIDHHIQFLGAILEHYQRHAARIIGDPILGAG